MLQYTVIPNNNIGQVEQTAMAISAGCQWIEIDPTDIDTDKLDRIIEKCRESEIILVFKHNDSLLEKTRVHGIRVGAGDADPQQLRDRLGGHPIVGVYVTPDTQLAPLKRADVDYIVLDGFPEKTTLETISKLREAETVQNINIPIVVEGHIKQTDIQAIIDAGASGINIDIESLQGPEYEASLAAYVGTCNSVKR